MKNSFGFLMYSGGYWKKPTTKIGYFPLRKEWGEEIKHRGVAGKETSIEKTWKVFKCSFLEANRLISRIYLYILGGHFLGADIGKPVWNSL